MVQALLSTNIVESIWSKPTLKNFTACRARAFLAFQVRFPAGWFSSCTLQVCNEEVFPGLMHKITGRAWSLFDWSRRPISR